MAENNGYAFVSSFPLGHARSNGAGGIEEKVIRALFFWGNRNLRIRSQIEQALSFWGDRNLRIEVQLGDDRLSLDMTPSGQKYVFTDLSRKKLVFLDGLQGDMTAIVYAEVKAVK